MNTIETMVSTSTACATVLPPRCPHDGVTASYLFQANPRNSYHELNILMR